MISPVIITIYSCLLVAIAAYDLRYRIVPNKLIYPGIGIAILLSYWWIGLTQSIIGGALGFLFMAIFLFLFRQDVGMGDVKMAAMVGLMVGFPLVMLSLALSVLLGCLVSIGLLLSKRMKRWGRLPFAPFLSIGAIVTLIWGGGIWGALIG